MPPNQREAKIPNTIDRVFKNCTNVISATVPTSVIEQIPKAKLQTVVITSGDSIADEAFIDCLSLESITIPESVISIGARAFEGCTSLTEIKNTNDEIELTYDAVFPSKLTHIGEKAFYNCDALTRLAILGDTMTIGKDAFGNMDRLSVIYWGAKNADITPNGENGVFNESGSLIASNFHWNGLMVFIDSDVQTIDDYTFAGLDIMTLTFNANSALQKIGEYAFANCVTLYSIKGKPVGIDEAETAFEGSKLLLEKLKDYAVNKLSVWNDFVFYEQSHGQYMLVDYISETVEDYVYLPDKVYVQGIEMAQIYSVADYAFAYRKDGAFVIPPAAKSVASNAFEGTSVKSIYEKAGDSYTDKDGILYKYTDGVPSIEYVPSNLSGDIELLEGLGSIPDYAFKGRTGITSITIPDSVTSIGREAFNDCKNITKVYVTSLKAWCEIRYNSYNYIHNPLSVANAKLYLKIDGEEQEVTGDIEIPQGTTRIGDCAFYGLTGITSITIPDSVTSIGYMSFNRCYIGTVNYLGDLKGWCEMSVWGYNSWSSKKTELFVNVNGVKKEVTGKVEIPVGTTQIAKCAFYGLTGITSVTIPDSVAIIGDYAFSGCTGLQTVTIEGVQSIGQEAFSGCTHLQAVYYEGTSEQWNDISIATFNDYLENADRYYFSAQDPYATQTAKEGEQYWHWNEEHTAPEVWVKEN